MVIEPIFEAEFLPCSFGFRPRCSAHEALQVLIDESWRGKRWVVETDIASCFEEIPHDRLMAAIEERVVDRKLLRLLGGLLAAGVMHRARSSAATPARRRAGWSRRCSPTSTCTGSTGHGRRAGPARWRATQTILW